MCIRDRDRERLLVKVLNYKCIGQRDFRSAIRDKYANTWWEKKEDTGTLELKWY